MNDHLNKVLTWLFFSFGISFPLLAVAQSALLSKESFPKHLRWNLKIEKDQVRIVQYPNRITIETLDQNLFEKFKKEFSAKAVDGKYVKSIEFNKDNFPEKPLSIKIIYTSENVEMFSFYKEQENKYILDFWTESSITNLPASKQISASKKKIKENTKRKIRKKTPARKKKLAIEKKKVKKPKHYRDFRYGASFTWNYAALLPKQETIVNIKNKTPEYFHPIKDRNYETDEKEAHMQLSINLYKRGKYGLMHKSISLYDQKFGDSDRNREINDYLKANALLRENKSSPDIGIEKSAINQYLNIAEKTEDYHLKRSIYQYLIPYMIKQNNYITALQYAKTLYVITKKNFDIEITEYATNIILFSLAKLNQIAKIEEFINEPSIKKILPKQKLMAYKSYVLLNTDRHKDLLFAAKKIDLLKMKSIDPALLFNLAEANFRDGNYPKAIKYFDTYATQFGHTPESSHAMLRTGLAYEILGRKDKQVESLYLNTINRSTVPAISYEAKLRLIGTRLVRKKSLNENDLKYLHLFDYNEKEKLALRDINLKKLLWLVRFRSLINQKKYKDALSYVTTLPLDSMKIIEKRVFDADTSEILYGVIHDYYNKGNYPEVVKHWEVYFNDYFAEDPIDPFLVFKVANSYLNLKLYQSFDRTVELLKKNKKTPFKTFPIWIDRNRIAGPNFLISELKILKEINSKKYQNALNLTNALAKDYPKSSKVLYYQSHINFLLKKYNNAIKSVENFIVTDDSKKGLSEIEVGYLLQSYYESLYQTDQLEKFESVADALLKDFENQINPV